MRCRKDSRDQAYVHGGGALGKDILIIGNENRNRAGKTKTKEKKDQYLQFCLLVHGDIVVVDLLSENNWTTASSEIAFNSSNAEDGKKKDICI